MRFCRTCQDSFEVPGPHWRFDKSKGTYRCLIKDKLYRETCDRAARKEYMRKYGLLNKYNLTLVDYEHLLKIANYKCQICKSDDWGGKHNLPQIDHDHITGQVRGILCTRCNRAIGFLKEDITILQNAIDYLKE